MLFYESAKCLHGRRSTLKGSYYGSIFVHYQPVDSSIWNYTVEVSDGSNTGSSSDSRRGLGVVVAEVVVVVIEDTIKLIANKIPFMYA